MLLNEDYLFYNLNSDDPAHAKIKRLHVHLMKKHLEDMHQNVKTGHFCKWSDVTEGAE